MTPSEMEKIIKKDGWQLVAVEGSHHQYKHPTKKGKVTVNKKLSDDLDDFYLSSIFKQAGWK